MRGVLLKGLPVLLLVVIPLSVHAGLFVSFMGNFEEAPKLEAVASAQDYNAQTTPLLRAALHTDPNPAKGGGDILVEDGALVPEGIESDESASRVTSNGEISVYTVREGDTLSEIAEMFDVTPNTILWANDISKASLIKPGTDLIILPITGVRHLVKKGDTIAGVAKKYGGDVEEIIAYNQLAGASDIAVGDTIVVPGGKAATAAPAKSSAGVKSGGSVAIATGSGSDGFISPLPGAVRTQGIHGYNGVDLAAPVGSTIRAAADGEVIVSKSSGWNGGYGNYVVVKHANGTQTLYSHMSSNAVAVGESVSAGQTVGAVGMTGQTSGAHLHFEVRGARNPF